MHTERWINKELSSAHVQSLVLLLLKSQSMTENGFKVEKMGQNLPYITAQYNRIVASKTRGVCLGVCPENGNQLCRYKSLATLKPMWHLLNCSVRGCGFDHSLGHVLGEICRVNQMFSDLNFMDTAKVLSSQLQLLVDKGCQCRGQCINNTGDCINLLLYTYTVYTCIYYISLVFPVF